MRRAHNDVRAITQRGGELQYRLTGADSGNSGIQYRSVELPNVARWVLKGYQADIDAQQRIAWLFARARTLARQTCELAIRHPVHRRGTKGRRVVLI